ncbi:MAG: alpha-L-fucosidase [Bacteroidales bacterium]|nr:alpha-L-fucosidase [Bacteroidales bacterium]
MSKRHLITLSLLAASLLTHAETYVHDTTDDPYQWPTDPAVLNHLHDWQQLKFGVLIHWGLYSQAGICESWPICSEDWITRPAGFSYDGFKQWYWGLSRDFCPTDFDASQWAQACADAGMRYVIFTTKHHDGFCLYPTAYTDFSIAHGPFARDARVDAVGQVFDAFRAKDFMIGAYFSKPDWHCQWYWNPYYATPNRRQNYKREQHPDWWERYRLYTQAQLDEITQRYAPLDILWLDGGWVSGDEIGLDSILMRARVGEQAGMLSVDRTIGGLNENYQTPEQTIPREQLPHPWESCISLSDDWGWTPNARFKSPQRIINSLAEIVAKGGSLVLGVGPTPQGLIQPEVVDILKEIGAWLAVNGEAIYGTVPTEVYQSGDIFFTAAPDGSALYAIYAHPEGEPMPAQLSWEGNAPAGSVTLLSTGQALRASTTGSTTTITLPRHLPAAPLALRFAPK